MSAERSVSKRRKVASWLLSYRDCIVAIIGATLILHSLDTDWTFNFGVGLFIGWFVPRNTA